MSEAEASTKETEQYKGYTQAFFDILKRTNEENGNLVGGVAERAVRSNMLVEIEEGNLVIRHLSEEELKDNQEQIQVDRHGNKIIMGVESDLLGEVEDWRKLDGVEICMVRDALLPALEKIDSLSREET
ncbi:hypothetical protein A2803_04700 [Candidatus Woesebacteria bacterium RIFCSPHIGHO2_01_FULL_44_21]|uniref:Uncharacterized protein n=1 Tax=Candidatus Woesebacteria bacterium RIFCSPHIGHO2_01_FULL_44_21 TaxID=1802503 RepID=A0A1F7Z1D1_9BACT|nr:MAG: hypothetical protein A2803_04700 [Candidatus Woesebacteria bacterium RIFCSPHIGHO2_01_FULL_44_21]OGM69417.1 MAG: hypothetical protein A2897_03630 [Candidatus Woesebacteria bacterium RIFCSPLOWO2_01_FULL_44_24b]